MMETVKAKLCGTNREAHHLDMLGLHWHPLALVGHLRPELNTWYHKPLVQSRHVVGELLRAFRLAKLMNLRRSTQHELKMPKSTIALR